MDAYNRLLKGYAEFRGQYLHKQYDAYREQAAYMQQPQIMVIGCSDSRVNASIITQSGLGELFMVNNVANLVPPYKEGKDTHHSTSAAIEFAVNFLKVKHIIILGHSGCGGIRALMEGQPEPEQKAYSFILPWMNIVAAARKKAQHSCGHLSLDHQAALCEKEALLVSLGNLKTFPWVKKAVDANRLHLHAWYFTIADGSLKAYDAEKGEFIALGEHG